MSGLNGDTETFSADGPTKAEISEQGNKIFTKFSQLAEKDIEGLRLVT